MGRAKHLCQHGCHVQYISEAGNSHTVVIGVGRLKSNHIACSHNLKL